MSRKVFYPTPTLPLLRGGSKKFTNDLGLLYNTIRSDVIAGLITTQTTALGSTDYILQDWAAAGLRVASVFRSFIVTLPPSSNLVLIGHLSERDWKEVRACLKVALADLE